MKEQKAIEINQFCQFQNICFVLGFNNMQYETYHSNQRNFPKKQNQVDLAIIEIF